MLFCGSCSDEIHKQLEFRMHNICLASAETDANGNYEAKPRPQSSGLTRRLSGRPTLRRYNSSLDALPGKVH